MSKINRALLSVSDKTGLVDFAEGLRQSRVELLSTGGTAKLLKEAGIKVTEIGDYTGFPEMLGGRVKTLHPKIHGGILARRDREDDLAALEKAGIPQIDLVVVNLYPFKQTIANPKCTLAEAIENIDIGGQTMLRSAAKNHASVAAVVDPADYPHILAEMKNSKGELSAETR
ncbi:MAG: bifunctional phosphoribosylaminoimidazolecarboxamide formyltransferase/IMP cyclohydrolase, partial [Burkholderiales bacterium]